MCVVLCPFLIDVLYWVIWVFHIFQTLLPYQILLLLFSHLVVSYSLQPYGLQHSRFLCPSLSPRACSNSCPLSGWYHPTISSSVIPFSSYLQSFPTSGSFPMSFLFASGGQGIGVSALASVLPVNIQGWFPLGLTGLISLLFKGLSRVLSNTTVWNHQFFSTQPSLWSNSHICIWLLEKLALTIRTFVGKVMSLHFNTLSRFVIAFLPRNKQLLISWLQSPSAVILEPKKIKPVTVSIFTPSICLEVMGPDAMILVFECWVLRQGFHSPLSPFWKDF